MPDILIRGMEMPHGKDHITITINADGTVQKLMDVYCKTIGQAIELPPHGDLVDKQETFKALSEKFKRNDGLVSWTDAIDIVLRSPVIVPADKEVQDALS